MANKEVLLKVQDFLSSCGTFYYATSENGKPKVRPFGFSMVIGDRFYIGMGDYKRCYRETAANPYIEICACKGAEWIRISGKAVFDPEANEKIFAAVPFLNKKYGEGTPLTHAPFYLEEMEVWHDTLAETPEKWM